MRSSFWEAVGIITGMIFGSGMFALPYAVVRSGLWWSIVSALVAFFAVLMAHLAYGELVVRSGASHRLPGYVRQVFGSAAGIFESSVQILSFNATLLIYGILGGVFLNILIHGIIGSQALTVGLFVFGSMLFWMRSAATIGFVNFILSLPLVFLVALIAWLGFRVGTVSNLISFSATDPFFSFGIFIFALSGLSVIADARSAFSSNERPMLFRRAIVIATTIPFVAYVLFTLSVLMVGGANVDPNAIYSLQGALGERTVWLGALIGFLAVFTSYLALGYDLRRIYELDIGVARPTSWFLVGGIPLAVFLSGAVNFVSLMSIVGGLFIALDGVWVVLLLRNIRRTHPAGPRFLPFGTLIQIFLIFIFTASALYELWYLVF